MPTLLALANVSVGPIEVKLGLALGLCLVLVALEALASLALASLGLAGRGRWRRLRPALALALPLAVVAPRLEGPELMVPTTQPARAAPGVPDLGLGPWDLLNDAVFQFLPWESEVRRSYAEGRLPLWSDRLQSSPWSNPQAQPLSPLAALARLFPLEHFLLAALAIKLLVAFDGAWALAALLGARPPFRALAATSFALGGGMLAWAVFPQSSALALVPWLVVAAVRLSRRRDRRFRVAATLAAATLAVGGHPEIAAGGGLLAVLAALAYRHRRRPLAPALGRLALAAALGAALAAPHLIPFAFEVRESQRFAELAAQRLPRPELERHRLAGWFPGAYLAYLRAPLGPEVFGRPYFGDFRGPFNWVAATTGYAGLAALAGTAAALASARSRRRAWPLALFALIALAAAARFEPLVLLVEALPGLRTLALERLLLPATLALAVAGALGADRLARAPTLAALAAAAAALAASLAAAATPRTIAIWVLLALAVALARHRRALAAAALAAAVTIDFAPTARDVLPAGFRSQLYPASPLLEELGRRGGTAPFRITGRGVRGYPAALAPLGFEDIRVHDPLADQRYLDLTGPALGFAPDTERYFSTVERPEHPFAGFLGLRFVLARDDDEPVADWARITHPAEPGWVAYESPDPAPRAFLPVALAPAPAAELGRHAAALADPRAVIVAADQEPAWLATLPAGSVGDEVALRERRDGRLVLHTRLAEPRLVATSLLEPEGWRVTARGRRLPTVPLFGAFLGLLAPAGEATIEIVYRPPGLTAGLALAGTAAAALLVPPTARLVRRRRR